MKKLVWLLTLSLLVAGCGAADETPGGADPTASTPGDLESTPVDESVPGVTRGPTEGGPAADFAVANLAERLSIPNSDITVVSAESVTWSDGSLGCPEPGAGYTQALVPGVRVILDVNGEQHHYHGTSADDLFFCETPRDPVAGDPGDA